MPSIFRAGLLSALLPLALALPARADSLPQGPLVQPPRSNPSAIPPGIAVQAQRVHLNPVHLTAKDHPGKDFDHLLWRGSGGFSSWESLLPAWPGTDVFTAAGRFFIFDSSETLKQVFADKNFPTPTLAFDGTYLWASFGFSNGIYVFDRDCKIVAHVPVAPGALLKTYTKSPLLAIAPGHILAVGDDWSSEGPSWVASIELVKDQPKVTILLQTNKPNQIGAEDDLDPTHRFLSNSVTEHTDADGNRWAFIGRHNRSPLMVNLKTLAVGVYPARDPVRVNSFPRTDLEPGAFLSHGGVFYVADPVDHFSAHKLDPDTHLLKILTPERSGSVGLQTGSLALADGFLYYAGEHCWQRLNIQTGVTEDLLTNPRTLPDYGSGQPWKLALSNNFGLVAWSFRTGLYHITITPPATTPAK
jgi:hypothetical protein